MLAIHKSGVIYERYEHDLSDADNNAVTRGFDDSTAIPMEIATAGVLFFSTYLLHSSRKNQIKEFRMALTFQYCSASTWVT